jgi:hypothetical protein
LLRWRLRAPLRGLLLILILALRLRLSIPVARSDPRLFRLTLRAVALL